MDYRYKHTLSVFKPRKNRETDRGNRDCCCELPVFFSDSSDEWKSDTTLAYFKKAVSSDTCEFRLTKCGTAGTLTNYGTAAVFPNDDLAVGYMFDWNLIEANHGIGTYTITLIFTLAGVSQTETWGVYNLQEWSQRRVNDLVRLRTVLKSYNQLEDIDFTGSNCFDTLRVPGIFGKRDPKTAINQLINKGYISEKVTRKNENTYLLETDPVSYCFTRFLVDLHMMNEDECYITEHNRKNHFYGYIDFPVHIAEPPQIEYFVKSRKSEIILTFGDRVKNDNTMFNGL